MAVFKSIALIPAAGMGKRMGATINKQYLQLNGLPIVARTISVFENSPLIDAIYLVIPADEIPYCREHVVEACGFKKVAAIVPGGKERQNSVMNGLNAMLGSVADDDVVLIHDGVRPLLTEAMLRESIAVARIRDGALLAVPVKDTIKAARDGIVINTPARENLWQAQTPQSFRFGIIREAHLSAEADGFIGTDDASLVERRGGEVCIVRGDYRNIKITTPEDLVLAEAFLAISEKSRLGQEREDFSLMLFHDMKNPMTAVIGSIDIIREGRLGPVNEEQVEYLQSSIDSCNEVVAMIDNLLDIRRFETGKVLFDIRPWNLRGIIQKVAEQFARTAEHDGIRFSLNLENSAPDVAVDRKAMARVLGNLLGNSMKFTPEGGEIAISCDCIENADIQRMGIPDYVSVPECFSQIPRFEKISVHDTGSGIPSEELGRIFDLYAQSRSGSGREFGGAGLGLAFCKWAVESFGGVIWAESDAGEGSEIVILLPCLPGETAYINNNERE
jgi:2-C-methyl-D-erythritol 4-phosphate cytidylyltransferase